MMMATLGQEDSIFAVLAVSCAFLMLIYMITSKNMNEEMRKPFVALIVATTIGILIYASQSIAFIVLLNLFIIVSTLQGMRLASANAGSTLSISGQSNGAVLQSSLRAKMGLLLRVLAVVIAVLLIAASLGYRFVGLGKTTPTAHIVAPTLDSSSQMPAQKPAVPVAPTLVPSVASAPVAASSETISITPATIDTTSQQAALSQYQQAKIEYDASSHTLDAAWQHLSKVSNKTAVATWKKAQTQWANAKHETCGKNNPATEISSLSAIELDGETKRLSCERDANLKRASYLNNNAYTVSEEKGHVDDDIGNLISTLKQK